VVTVKDSHSQSTKVSEPATAARLA
jgi:hypothetical protein